MVKMTQQRRLLLLLGVLVAVAAVLIVRNLPEGSMAADVLDGKQIEYEPRELPQLIAEESAAYGGDDAQAARNPFTFGAPPTPTRNLTPRPTLPPPPPRTPRPTPAPRLVLADDGTVLPPPPRFDRAYLGHFGPRARHVAVFRDGTKLDVAMQGDVLDDVFVLREIGLESVVIGFVGYPEKETTRVPLAEN